MCAGFPALHICESLITFRMHTTGQRIWQKTRILTPAAYGIVQTLA
jgi:hypothetical protein